MVLPNYNQHAGPYKGLKITLSTYPRPFEGDFFFFYSHQNRGEGGWIAPFLLFGSDSPWHGYQGMNESPEY